VVPAVAIEINMDQIDAFARDQEVASRLVQLESFERYASAAIWVGICRNGSNHGDEWRRRTRYPGDSPLYEQAADGGDHLTAVVEQVFSLVQQILASLGLVMHPVVAGAVTVPDSVGHFLRQ